jgi:hypothetical protein
MTPRSMNSPTSRLQGRAPLNTFAVCQILRLFCLDLCLGIDALISPPVSRSSKLGVCGFASIAGARETAKPRSEWRSEADGCAGVCEYPWSHASASFQMMPRSKAGAASTGICFWHTTVCTTRDAICRARVSKRFGLAPEMKFDTKKSARATALSCVGNS